MANRLVSITGDVTWRWKVKVLTPIRLWLIISKRAGDTDYGKIWAPTKNCTWVSLVTWPVMSREPERSSWWPSYIWIQISQKALVIAFKRLCVLWTISCWINNFSGSKVQTQGKVVTHRCQSHDLSTSPPFQGAPLTHHFRRWRRVGLEVATADIGELWFTVIQSSSSCKSVELSTSPPYRPRVLTPRQCVSTLGP